MENGGGGGGCKLFFLDFLKHSKMAVGTTEHFLSLTHDRMTAADRSETNNLSPANATDNVINDV